MPKVLRVFLFVTVLLFMANLAAEVYCRHTPTLNHMPYTHVTLDPSDDYADFRMFLLRFHHFHERDFFSPKWGSDYLYPATVGMLYEPFFAFHLPFPGQRFMAVVALAWLLLSLWLRRVLIARGLSNQSATLFAAIAGLGSYPLYFEFNRANVEIFIWMFAGLGVIAFVKDRPWAAATCFGIAGACKIYPFVYIALLISRKQYKQAAWAIVVGAIFTVFSLWALTGSITVSRLGTAAGLEEFRQVYVLHKRFGEIGLDHSIFGMYKRFAFHLPPPEQLAHLLSIYLAVAAIVACIAYFARAIRMPMINQVIFLTIACIVLPPTSYDYTLLHLYTPFVLMLLLVVDFSVRRAPLPPGTWAVLICFMLLLAPLNEVIVHGERIAGQLKCIILLVLAALALRYRFVSGAATLPVTAG